MDNQDSQNVSTLVVVNGGVEINVEFQDSRKELVKVRQLPLRQMASYGDALSDETKLCQLLTDKDAAWVDSLTLPSQDEIVTLGGQLNDDFFLRWADRRLATAEKVGPRMARLNSATPASPS